MRSAYVEKGKSLALKSHLIIIRDSSNLSSRKNLDVRPYDRPYKVLLLACAANCTAGTILAVT